MLGAKEHRRTESRRFKDRMKTGVMEASTHECNVRMRIELSQDAKTVDEDDVRGVRRLVHVGQRQLMRTGPMFNRSEVVS